MAWGEAKAWLSGALRKKLYQDMLDDAASAPVRNAKRKKIVRPADMPWEMARQGLLKHLLNEGMNTRMETVDAYMEIIPAGSRSGKHRHLAEECVYVLEGRGYEIHDGVRYDWQAGDVAVVHNNCVHQHFNADPKKPARALVMKCKPMYMFMNMLFQTLVEPRPTTPAPGAEGFQAREGEQNFNHSEGDR